MHRRHALKMIARTTPGALRSAFVQNGDGIASLLGWTEKEFGWSSGRENEGVLAYVNYRK